MIKNTVLGCHFLIQGSSQPTDQTQISSISCTGKQILYLWHHLAFLRLYPSTAFWTLVYYEGYAISSKGFLLTLVDIMVIWLNLPIPIHFSSLISKMSVLTLVISCLTLSICLDYGPNILGSYATLLFTTLDFTLTTRHIHNWPWFLLWLWLGSWSPYCKI